MSNNSPQSNADSDLQERLALAQRRFSNLIRSLPVSIAIVDSLGQIEATSPQLRSLLNYGEEELLAENISTLLVDAPWNDSSFEQWRLDNPDRPIELEACSKDGDRIVVDFSVRQLEQDRRGRQVVILQDVSERFLANKLKQEFFQMVNHDIRAPLTGISTFLESLKEPNKYGTLTEVGLERLLFALINVDRIMTLASGILELSGLESGGQLKFAELNTKELLSTAESSVRELADAKQISIASTLEETILCGDSVRLVQVLVNLLTNAIEHSPVGKSIELRGWKTATSYSVSIRDQGPGIPDWEKPLIFERFHRGFATKSVGYGLGLSISKQIIVQHGGTISCTNADGGGSTFLFTIPLKVPDDNQCSVKSQ